MGRVRSEDPGLLVVKRSVRAAVVMPAVFGLAHVAFSNPQVALFGAFGSFGAPAPGGVHRAPLRRALAGYGGLYVVGAWLHRVLGTVVSTHKVAAVVTMALVGFAVLFAGIRGPAGGHGGDGGVAHVRPARRRGAAGVGGRAPAGRVGRSPRASASRPACSSGRPRGTTTCAGAWPRPSRPRWDLADVWARGVEDPEAYGACVVGAGASLRGEFSGTPYPPVGAASGAVALSKLVGRVEWVASNSAMIRDEHWSTEPAPALAVTQRGGRDPPIGRPH